MQRRQFIATVAALTALGAASLANGTTREQEPFPLLDEPLCAKVSDELADDFTDLLGWLSKEGWLSFLQDVSGQPSTGATPNLTTALSSEQLLKVSSHIGFEDFGGVRLLEPGKPALSLLYYALASPRVKLPAPTPAKQALDTSYPMPEHLDRLENYIYALAPLTVGELGDDCVLAVFAYEFRPSPKTPHRQHADLVFSRTGISRVGTMSRLWDRQNRRFVSRPHEGSTPQDAAVTPARYGLFLARRVKEDAVERIGTQRHDRTRYFLLPWRKIVSGDAILAGMRVSFSESHRDEKLARLFKLGLPDGSTIQKPSKIEFDYNAPPFLRNSCSSTGPSDKELLVADATRQAEGQQLVSLISVGSSALLESFPAPLVREARQKVAGRSERARFQVPEFNGGATLPNRRYTSLKLLEKPLLEALDFGASDVLFRGGRFTTEFHSPRNGPVFVNIRYRMSAETGDALQHLEPSVKDWEQTIRDGGYWAALFQDNLCDGCVQGEFIPKNPLPGKDYSVAQRLVKLPILPAFSLVAAPDFFSLADPFDLSALDNFFLEGGTESVSGARVRANPNLRLPGSSQPAFPLIPPTNSVEAAATYTVTAVVSAAAARQCSPIPRDYESTNSLPDSASNIFAPGWDVTYADADGQNSFYFASFGLGSPFPEDMKLCAAANGMWAALSPDASRTFYGSLEGIGTTIMNTRKRRPSTAVPLLDWELGWHPRSPAVRHYGQHSSLGWDGEQGPFLEISERQRQININFTDINRADYVVNALKSSMNMSLLQPLTSQALLARMEALRTCIRHLPGSNAVRLSKLWLVSAEEIPAWSGGAQGYGIPPQLVGNNNQWATTSQLSSATGAGFLLAFATMAGVNQPASELDAEIRLIVNCATLYVCQLAQGAGRWHIAWVAVPTSGPAPTPDTLRWHHA